LSDALQWRLASLRVAGTQASILNRILRENSNTVFGRKHGFSNIRTVSGYQEHVPLLGYSELEPLIDRVAAGERDVLTVDAVQSFALSSGSSAATKLIPYTPSLLRDIRRGISPWLAGLYLEHPSLLLGKSYWQVSPAGTPGRVSSGGIRIGFGEDSEYFGRFRGGLVRATLAVPEQVSGITDMDAFRFHTLRHLLTCGNLRFISVWNPSFLTLLLAELPTLAPALIDRIRADGHERRAAELHEILDTYKGVEFTQSGGRNRTLGESIWRRLRVISCWCDAGAREAASHLQAAFPSAIIQPKGLIATEGIMSLPWRARGAALALRSHFFEFLETAGDNPKLAHELQAGRTYSIVLTTSGGLYRYRIGDQVEVTGWIGQCPLLRFRGKESGVSDMVGEKLNSAHVVQAVEQVLARLQFVPEFWMVAPESRGQTQSYTLYLQSKSAAPHGLAAALDAALGENFHYAYARRLGQLAPLSLFPIDPASAPEADYLKAQQANGRRLGGIKRPLFDQTTGWSDIFQRDLNGAA
jgi:hypothetical protein